MPQHRLIGEEYAVQIDGEHPAPFLLCDVEEGFFPSRHPGIGKDTVDPAHGLQCGRKTGIDLGFFRDIADERQGFLAMDQQCPKAVAFLAVLVAQIQILALVLAIA